MNNEKAFPYEEWIYSNDPKLINPIRHTGMDLRDYFAAKVINVVYRRFNHYDPDVLAIESYKLADAMMKAREKCEN